MTHGHDPGPTSARETHEEPHGGEGRDGGAHGGADDASAGSHGHGGEVLGPIDWSAWGAGAAGVAVGLVIALCFVLATGAAA